MHTHTHTQATMVPNQIASKVHATKLILYTTINIIN